MQMALERILIGTDGSQGATEAIEWAVRELAPMATEIILVHVYDRLDDIVEQRERVDFPELRARAQRVLDEEWAAPLRDAGVRVRTLLLEGRTPNDVIADAARNEDADLVVVGDHGRSGWRDRVIGSVASKLVSVSRVPVVVVPQRRPTGR
jgi:nucleotide-binding universal stress UspA family protein